MSFTATQFEQLENITLASSNGLVDSTSDPTLQNPFYMDANTGDIMFGFGYNVTARGTSGLSSYLSPAILTLANDTVADYTKLSSLNQLVSSTYGANTNWQSVAVQVEDALRATATSEINTALVTRFGITLASLPVGVQAGLISLAYDRSPNDPAFENSALTSIAYGGIASAAATLVANTTPTDVTLPNGNDSIPDGLEQRLIVDGLEILGFNVTVDQNNNVASLSGSVSNATALNFLAVVQSSPTGVLWLTTPEGMALQSAIQAYTGGGVTNPVTIISAPFNLTADFQEITNGEIDNNSTITFDPGSSGVIDAGKIVNNAIIMVGDNSKALISGPISSDDAITTGTTINGIFGTPTNPVLTTITATGSVTLPGALVGFGSLHDLMGVNVLPQDQTITQLFGTPSETVGVGVTGVFAGGSQASQVPDSTVPPYFPGYSTTITLDSSATLPEGTAVVVSDPGGAESGQEPDGTPVQESGPYVFQVIVKNNGVVVSPSDISYSLSNPYGSTDGSYSIDPTTGVLTVLDYGFGTIFPSRDFVVVPHVPYTSITVNGTTIGDDQLFVGIREFTPTVVIGTGSSLELGGAVTNQNIAFQDGGSQLVLDSPASFLGTIANVGDGDTIVLPGVIATAATFTTGENGQVMLNVPYTLGGGGVAPAAATVLSIPFAAGTNTNVAVTAQSDGDGGTEIVFGSAPPPPPCFAAGTHIETDRGPVKVQDLRVGDKVKVLFGPSPHAPVEWIGQRTVNVSQHPEPKNVLPILVQQGAFAPSQPSRPLLLSPDHAIYDAAQQVLIPVKYLINHTTVAQIPAEGVNYFHVQVKGPHNVVYAEGVTAETYLDTGDRSNFANGGEVVKLHPDFSTRVWEANGVAPLEIVGPRVDAVKAQLLARAEILDRDLGQQTARNPDAGARADRAPRRVASNG